MKNITYPAFLLASMALASVGLAQESSLSAAIKSGLENDPELMGLLAKTRADTEALPQARSGLLPRIQFQSTRTNNSTTQRSLAPGIPEFKGDYSALTQSLTLSQALYRRGAWMNLLKSEAAVSASESALAAGIQRNIDRVVFAFGEKLRLEMELKSSHFEIQVKRMRHEVSNRQLAAGFASRVDVKMAEADLEQELAKNEDLSTRLSAANLELMRLTGREWSEYLSKLENAKPCGQLIWNLIKSKVDDHVDRELDSHPEINTLKLRYEQAGWEIKKRESDHYPSLDLVASTTQGRSASDFTIGRETNTQAIGVQLTIPIYSGGSVSSYVREAVALQDKAEMELRNMRLTVRNDRTRMLSQLRSSIKRLEADIVAYDAADLAFLLEFRRLDTNLGSSIDLSSAESRKMNAAAKLISSSAEAITYYSKLRIAQGDLVPEMMLEFSNSLLTCTQARDN